MTADDDWRWDEFDILVPAGPTTPVPVRIIGTILRFSGTTE